MPPTSSQDFQKVAGQRLTTAQELLRIKLTLDAQYIGGYTVECSLKALILHLTPEKDKPATLARITAGAEMHKHQVLFNELKTLGVVSPVSISRRMRKFKWGTALRYETGKLDVGETVAFLKTAQTVYDWVEGQLS